MREVLTGSRIRDRRMMAGIKQADLARSIGISASYLNLIEHNRRRIGGKVLLAIARALSVEPQMLTEGAEATLIASLREAALDAGLPEAEAASADEFAGRFPNWAEVLARGRQQIAALERTVEELTDRLAHDPQLAASVHELLSTAAAVRSTAAILADNEGLEPEWRTRFHANINEDSRRLADSAQSVVDLLEQETDQKAEALSPQEEVEAFLSHHAFRFDGLETGKDTPETLIAQAKTLGSQAAQYIARGVLDQIARDAAVIPLRRLESAIGEEPVRPVVLARALDVPMPVLLRRLAALDNLKAGLVVCDRSGTVIFRKSVAGFSIPRFGACCPLWPLFAALGQPGLVVQEGITQKGRGLVGFDAYAASEAQGTPGYNRPPMLQSVMLLIPNPREDREKRTVGPSCRICSHDNCAARREPSILQAAQPEMRG